LISPESTQNFGGQPWGTTEGRAAYEGANTGYWSAHAAPVAPNAAPEDRTYYSRGR
jgi:hypothetical protein